MRNVLPIAVLLTVTAVASGQETRSFDLDHLQLQTSGGDFVATEGAGGALPWSYHADVTYRFSDAQLIHQVGSSETVLVGRRSLLDLTGGVQLGRWVGIGLDVPLLVDQSGLMVDNGAALGDLRLVPRVDLLHGPRFGLSLLGGLRLPTGTTERFLGEGGVVFEPRLAAEVRLGIVHVGLNVGARVRQFERSFMGVPVGNELTSALAVAVVPTSRIDLVAELHADTAASAMFGKRAETPVEALAGLGVHIGPIRVGAAVGAGVVDGIGSPRVRVLASVQYLQRGREAAPSTVRLIAKAPEKKPEPKKPAPAPVAVAQAAPVEQVEPESESEPESEPARPRETIGDPLTFDRNSKRLRSSTRGALQKLAELLSGTDGVVWVEGHADEPGSHELNQHLSQERAEMVASFLIAQGLDSKRVQPVGLGDMSPIDARGGDNERNRSVVISVEHAAFAGGASSTFTKGLNR